MKALKELALAAAILLSAAACCGFLFWMVEHFKVVPR